MEIKLKAKCNLKPNMHLVLVKWIRDVVAHVAGRVGQNNDHMGVRGGRRG